MYDSSPTSMAYSSSFSITRPRYLTCLSVMMAAALADSFFGDDDFFSTGGSSVEIKRAGLLDADLDDYAADSSETLFSILLI